MPTRVDLTNSGALAAISTTGGPLYVCGVGMVGFIATASYPYACTPVSELSDSLAFLRVGGLRCAVRRSGRVTCRVLEGLRDAAFVDA